MDCSMPGFPVHHQLPKLTQTHVHRVGDPQPSHPSTHKCGRAINLGPSLLTYRYLRVPQFRNTQRSFSLSVRPKILPLAYRTIFSPSKIRHEVGEGTRSMETQFERGRCEGSGIRRISRKRRSSHGWEDQGIECSFPEAWVTHGHPAAQQCCKPPERMWVQMHVKGDLLLGHVGSGQNQGNDRHTAPVSKHDHLLRAPAMSQDCRSISLIIFIITLFFRH